jgi:hypothetical protein
MKRIENTLKIFPSIVHANKDRAEVFFSVLNFAIPVFIGTYIFLNLLPLSAVSKFCFYLSLDALIILISFKKTAFTLLLLLILPFLFFLLLTGKNKKAPRRPY